MLDDHTINPASSSSDLFLYGHQDGQTQSASSPPKEREEGGEEDTTINNKEEEEGEGEEEEEETYRLAGEKLFIGSTTNYIQDEINPTLVLNDKPKSELPHFLPTYSQPRSAQPHFQDGYNYLSSHRSLENSDLKCTQYNQEARDTTALDNEHEYCLPPQNFEDDEISSARSLEEDREYSSESNSLIQHQHNPGIINDYSISSDGSEYRPCDKSIDEEGDSEPNIPYTAGDQCSEIDEFNSSFVNQQRLLTYIDKLYDFETIGCGPDLHRESFARHMSEESEDNHYPLSATFNTNMAWVQNRNSSPIKIGLEGKDLPRCEEQTRKRFASAKSIQRIVEGVIEPGKDKQGTDTDNGRTIKNICLHQEPVPTVDLVDEWDIDGVIIFPRSLAAFKTSLYICLTKQVRFNIDADLHITRQVPGFDKKGRETKQYRQLRSIPHLYIGSVRQFKNSAIYIFFPWLIDSERKTSWLTDKEADKFISSVFIPACEKVVSNGRQQHLPSNNKDADLKALAKGIEHQSIGRERGLKQHREIPLPADCLGNLVSYLDDRINSSDTGLRIFRDYFVFMNVKNTKLDFKEERAWQSIEKFNNRLDEVFHRGQREVISDLGRELYPQPPTFNVPVERNIMQNTAEENSGQSSSRSAVALWRACCLEKQAKDLIQYAFDGHAGQINIFHNAFLRDSTCMTAVPPRRSWAYQAGLVYAQWYTSVKLIEDANKVYPFDHAELVNLAIDQSLYREVTFGKARRSLLGSYAGSKDRVLHAYQSALWKWFGIRIELRLLEEILLAIAEAGKKRDHPLERPLRHPDVLWLVYTSSWCEFMLGNYNKWTSLVELAVLSSPKTGIPVERSKLLFILLKCLQNFGNCDITRSRLLKWSQRTVDGKELYGLGLGESISIYGYGWLQEIVDWEQLQFRDEFSQRIVTLDEKVGVYYKSSGRLAQSSYSVLELCFRELKVVDSTKSSYSRALEVVTHYILRQYRLEVLDALGKKGDLRSEFNTEEEKSEVMFSYEGLARVMIEKPHLVSGLKTKCKHPIQLFEWLMGFQDDFNREFIDGTPEKGEMKSWRKNLYKMAELSRTRPNLNKDWIECLQRQWRNYFWVVPYPDPNGTFISTVSKKAGLRQFYSSDITSSGTWIWAKTGFRSGIPKPYPKLLSFDVAGIQQYLHS